ncbi:MAG: glycosyltransferase family 2 protein [Lachnospiraceae bacterium]|nr:glycosyltransferase family 2 protein [Lachnospiraceae bacterium]
MISLPLISIIVPIYNTELYLDRCLNSLHNQTYHNLEIILINDGSTDKSEDICKSYIDKNSRFIYFHQNNAGPMAACHHGISVSKGEYLCFVDSDDQVDINMISEMFNQLKLNTDEIVCCNMNMEYAYGTFAYRHGLPSGVYEGIELQDIFRNIVGNEEKYIFLSRAMKLISRNLIVNNLHYCDSNLKIGEDSAMILPALFDSKRIVIMKDAFFYHYYYNSGSLMHGYLPNFYQHVKKLNAITNRIMTEKVVSHKYSITAAEIEKQCLSEHLFQIMLAVKNEVRGNQNGSEYRRNIKMICSAENTRKIAKLYPLNIKRASNRLLYLVIKNPCNITIVLLRAATKIFYLRKEL